MKISDEMLSAFLDAELSEEDMEAVRCALETDDDLVMRLAELAQVDHAVLLVLLKTLLGSVLVFHEHS